MTVANIFPSFLLARCPSRFHPKIIALGTLPGGTAGLLTKEMLMTLNGFDLLKP